MKRLLIILVPWVIHLSPLKAQLSESDSLKRAFLINATGNLSYGNVDRQFLLSNLQYVHRIGDSWAFKTQNSHRFGRSSKSVVANDLLALNYLYYKPRNKFYPYAVVFLEKSRRKKIDDRWIGGVGVTMQAVRSEKSLIKLSLTGFYESTDYEENEFEELGLRSTTVISMPKVAFRIFGRHDLEGIPLQFYYVGRVFRSLSDLGDYRTNLSFGIDFSVTSALAFTTRANFTNEDIIVSEQEANDLLITYGLRIKLSSRE